MVDGVAKLVFVSVAVETDDSRAPYEALYFHLPSLRLFLTLVEQMVAGFNQSVLLPSLPNL